jgi:MFS family permease
MIADVARREERTAAFSMLRIAGNLGWSIGPAMGGFLAHFSYSSLFFFSAVLNLISGIYFLVTLRDLPRSERTADAAFRFRDLLDLRRDRLILHHCAISFLVFLVMAQLIAALSVYTVDTIGITQAELGTLYTLNGLMVVVLQLPTSMAFRKCSLTRQLAIGSIVYAAGYLLVGIAGGYLTLFICMIVITMGEIITIPPALTLVTNLSPAGAYGRYMGMFGFFQTGGWSFGPTVGGILLDLFPTRPLFTWGFIGGIALTAAALYLRFGRQLSDLVNSESSPVEADVAHVPG